MAQKINAKLIASMRGNLQQVLSVPEENRTPRQRKALLKIKASLAQAEQIEAEKNAKLDARLVRLRATPLVLASNPSLVFMIVSTLMQLRNEEGYVPGPALKNFSKDNPLMSSEAYQQLASLGYVDLDDQGHIFLNASAFALIKRPL